MTRKLDLVVTCACSNTIVDFQAEMPAAHALMAEVIPNVRLVRFRCGHLAVGVCGAWDQAHTDALAKAFTVLGRPCKPLGVAASVETGTVAEWLR